MTLRWQKGHRISGKNGGELGFETGHFIEKKVGGGCRATTPRGKKKEGEPTAARANPNHFATDRRRGANLMSGSGHVLR